MNSDIKRDNLKTSTSASFWPQGHLNNVGHVVTEAALRMPDAIAVAAPKMKRATRPIVYDTISFSELELQSNRIALGMRQIGVRPGTRLALMVPPGIPFVTLVFGLFKAGAVVILIDPGMGRKNMIRCLAEAKPEGMVGIGLAHLMRNLMFWKFPVCRSNVVVGSKRWPGCTALSEFEKLNANEFTPLAQTRESDAAIIFTTGSTGPPKGVLYRHRVFLEQARQIRDYFEIEPGGVDVSGFPLFALFNCAMGTTTVFPQMDATRPADVDPLDIKDAVEQFHANQSFGSPALWNTVSRYAVENDIRFPMITKIFSAGAPVPPHVLNRIRQIIHPDGEAYTPYGATESLPVACNDSRTVLQETAELTNQGKGTCVGHKFPDIQWKVIEISDEPIADINGIVETPHGVVGELIVKGAVVTEKYVTQTKANAFHKIKDGDSFWHRMGDVGYLDDHQRFWFCGRKSHRVVTTNGNLFTIVVEGIVNTHRKVYRSALIGLGDYGKQVPVVVVEPWPEHWSENTAIQNSLAREILDICHSNDRSNEVQHVLLKNDLPVDIRHNSKIFREKLVPWAAEKLRMPNV